VPRERAVLVRRPQGLVRAVLEAAGVATVAGIAAAAMLDMFRVSPRVPRVYNADGLSSAAWVKGITETGWVNSNPRLGAPFGQIHYDYPLGGDNLHFLMMRALALVTGDWVLIVNVFFVGTFATAAFSAYLAQRWLGVGRLLGAVVALVFAFLPYHFVRGPEHLLLSSYFVVPVAVVLAARVYSGLPSRDERPPLRSVAMLRSILPWVGVMLVVGSCGAYYAVFAVLLVAVAALLGAVTARSTSPLLAGALAILGVGVTLVGNLSGSIRFRRANGANELVAERSVVELDSYPLRLADLVIPLRETRWPGAGTLAERATLPLASSIGQYQGLVGATCLVALAAWLVAGRGARGTNPEREWLAAGVVAFLAIGTTGGLAWLGNIVGFTQIRVLSRATVFISFLALTWGALSLAGPLHRWIQTDQRRTWVVRCAAAVLIAVAWFDQVPSPVTRDPGAAANYASDVDYFVGIESDLDPGSAVFVLPVRGYPEEAPTVFSADYDLLRPYLSSRTLRFSYGGIKGREMEWQRQLTPATPEDLLVSLVATEFDGLLVDRFGYADEGAALLGAVSDEVNADPRIDATGRWAYFDLRTYAEDVSSRVGADELAAQGFTLLQDPVVTLSDCYEAEPFEATTATWCPSETTVSLRTATEPARARLSARVYAVSDATLTITWGRSTVEVPIGPSSGEFDIELDVSPTASELTFSTDADQAHEPGSPRDLRMRIIDLDAQVLAPSVAP
jgi:hypothetical protein